MFSKILLLIDLIILVSAGIYVHLLLWGCSPRMRRRES